MTQECNDPLNLLLSPVELIPVLQRDLGTNNVLVVVAINKGRKGGLVSSPFPSLLGD